MNYIDFNNICRLCAFDRDLQPIEDNFVIDLFQKLIDVNYSKTDKLPQKICETCIQTIYNVQEFVLQCKTTNLRLKKYVSNLKNNSYVTSISDETINSETLSCTANDKNVNTTELIITNIVSKAETNDSQLKTEHQINAPLNCSKEILDISLNDEFLVYNELNVESEIITTTFANESSVEISECIELNVEPEEDTSTETKNDLMDTRTESNITINTDNKTNHKNIDLEKVLLDLQNEFSFDEESDLVNKELNLVSLGENESIAEDMEQTQITIPRSHLLTFDDDIVIVEVVSPNCKYEMKSHI